MTARPIPKRHWSSYGGGPLPSSREALGEPFRAFPSWFMRITCDRCGKDRMLNEAHIAGPHAEPTSSGRCVTTAAAGNLTVGNDPHLIYQFQDNNPAAEASKGVIDFASGGDWRPRAPDHQQRRLG